MKNIYIVGFALLAAGCNKFIDVQPKSFSNASTFYNSVSGISEGVNGAYNGLQTIYGTGSSFWTMAEERSDNTTFEYNNSDRGALQREQMDFFMVTTDNTYLQGTWGNFYTGIAQCNAVLDNVGKVKMSDSLKNLYAGQAEFMRALYYFDLVRLFGGVPLILHAVVSPDDAFAKNGRATADSVYIQIIKDAQGAATKLPKSWPDAEAGKATQGAAHTLLGEVYMTRKDFQSALTEFDKVSQLGYALLPNYADLFDPNHKNSVESIFEIQFSSAIQGEASSFIYNYAPLYSGYKTIASFSSSSGSGRNIPTRNMLNSYEKNDKREAASIAWFVDPLNEAYDEAQHDSMPYIKKFAAPPSLPNEQDVDFPVYRYAQVLLWEAEAYNELGQTAQAYPEINKVRNRAGLADLTPGLNQAAFRKAVYHEERVESAFEDHRWFQLLRTETAIDVMTQHGKEQKTYQKWLPDESYDMQAYKLIFPIPLREVTLNNLEQNPGWH